MLHSIHVLAGLILGAVPAPQANQLSALAAVDLGFQGTAGALFGLVDGPGGVQVVDLGIATGRDVGVRAFGTRGFVVLDRDQDRVLVLDGTGALRRTHQLPTGTRVRDALHVGRHLWLTVRNGNALLRLQHQTGALTPWTDLTPVLRNESVADPESLISDGVHVFVQVQRLDDAQPWVYEPHGALAVIELATGALVDVDPAAPGVQAIELLGPTPRLPMHFTAAGELLVSATGPSKAFELGGGIERVDPIAFTSLGFAVDELTAANLGGFVPVSPTLAVGMFHTDIIESTHVFRFRLPAQKIGFFEEFHELFSTGEAIAFDAARSRVLIPGTDGALNLYDPVTRMRTRIPLVQQQGALAVGLAVAGTP